MLIRSTWDCGAHSLSCGCSPSSICAFTSTSRAPDQIDARMGLLLLLGLPAKQPLPLSVHDVTAWMHSGAVMGGARPQANGSS